MYCLLEVVSVFPEKLASRFVDKIDWIKVSFVGWFFVNLCICTCIKLLDNVGLVLTFPDSSLGCTNVVSV